VKVNAHKILPNINLINTCFVTCNIKVPSMSWTCNQRPNKRQTWFCHKLVIS